MVLPTNFGEKNRGCDCFEGEASDRSIAVDVNVSSRNLNNHATSWRMIPALFSTTAGLSAVLLLLLLVAASMDLLKVGQWSFSTLANNPPTAVAAGGRSQNSQNRYLHQISGDTTAAILSKNNGDIVCPTCFCECSATAEEGSSNFNGTASGGLNRTVTLNIVALQASNIYSIVEGAARAFEKYKAAKADEDPHQVRVKINVAKSIDMPTMYKDIIDDAKSGGGMFDGYFTNPVILGTVLPLNNPGLLDLSPYVHAQQTQTKYTDIDLDWTDILLPFRKFVAQFEGKIYMLPLDGDIHSMYVRKDILEYFGLTVPRTWPEYNAVAKFLHGKVYNNITLSGSCVSRVIGSHGQYWSHLILASMTQTDGPSTGSLFDTQDMKPLTGEAFVETLKLLEEQARYGAPTEFDDLNLHEVHSRHMNDGTCALTYSWGDTYKLHRAEGSVIGPGMLGVYPTPGSTRVLDRKTMKLVPCTKERCKHGVYYDDIGWVNHSPYLANGGWSGAVSANAEPEKQDLVAELFLFACSKDQAVKGVIPQSTTPLPKMNSQDPFRKSQLEVQKWVDQGYDDLSAKDYQVTVLKSTLSKNLAVDMRTPVATEIMGVLDELVHNHLIKVRNGNIPDNELPTARAKTTERITESWIDLVQTYDARGDTEIPILQVYQRLRDIYVAKEEKNQLTNIRPVGWTLMSIVFVTSFSCVLWVFRNRGKRIVKASQPIFLDIICLGSVVMASCIIPMSIDDSLVGQKGCDIACMMTPWLAATGFTLLFSALFSKVWRLNKLFKNAVRFQRVQVAPQDVMMPLVVLLSLNTIFLAVWTATDPLYFERVDTGRTGSGELSSYGRCTSDGVVSLVMLSLILAVNAVALLLANWQAYTTRNLSTEYSESKYIGLSMLSILQACLIGTPVVVLANSDPVASYIVRSMLVFVVSMSVLMLLFMPKFVHQTRYSRSINSSNSRVDASMMSHTRTRSYPYSGAVSSSINSAAPYGSGVSTTLRGEESSSFAAPRRPSTIAPTGSSIITNGSNNQFPKSGSDNSNGTMTNQSPADETGDVVTPLPSFDPATLRPPPLATITSGEVFGAGAPSDHDDEETEEFFES